MRIIIEMPERDVAAPATITTSDAESNGVTAGARAGAMNGGAARFDELLVGALPDALDSAMAGIAVNGGGAPGMGGDDALLAAMDLDAISGGGAPLG